MRTRPELGNSTNGSWWSFKVLPTKSGRDPSSEFTNGSWWSLKSHLQTRALEAPEFHQRQLAVFKVQPTKSGRDPSSGNPTNGSWWFFKVLPTKRGRDRVRNPTNGSWWSLKSCLQTRALEAASRIPPTAVGGIPNWVLFSL